MLISPRRSSAFLILISGVLLLLLSACAGVGKGQALITTQPTHQSLYYFTVGAYVQNTGNFQLSGELLDKARQFDIGNPVIRKYILINDIFSYHSDLIGKREFESRLKRQTNSYPGLLKDETVLLGLYSVYTTKKDSLEINRYLTALEQDHPSSTIYLWRFYYNHSYRHQLDLESLTKAESLAVSEPENLLQIARIYSVLNPEKALQVAKQANELQPTPESQALVAGLMMSMKQTEPVNDIFGAFVYPKDKPAMLGFLDTAMDQGDLDTVLRNASAILKTEDSDLLLHLTTVAFSRGDNEQIRNIEAIMSTKTGSTQADSRIYAILLANAITQNDVRDLSLYCDRLYSLEDLQSVLSYSALYFAGLEGIEMSQLPPKVYNDCITRFASICPDSTYSGYIQLYGMMAYATVDQKELIRLSEKICTSLIARGYGNEQDYLVVTSALQVRGAQDELMPLLKKAVGLFPMNAVFLNSYGYSLILDPATTDEGAGYVNRALDLEPNTPYYLDSLAWYYYLKGDYATAMNLMKIPMQEPNLPAEILYHLGMISKALDRLDDARVWFQKAITAGDSEDFTAKSRAELDLIGH